MFMYVKFYWNWCGFVGFIKLKNGKWIFENDKDDFTLIRLSVRHDHWVLEPAVMLGRPDQTVAMVDQVVVQEFAGQLNKLADRMISTVHNLFQTDWAEQISW